MLEQKVVERTRELERLSRTDPLTDLRNQRALIEELHREVLRAQRHCRPLTAMYLDLDGFNL